MHIRALLSSGDMGGNHFVYVKETGHDGDPAAVLEGGSKAQMDFDLSEVSTPRRSSRLMSSSQEQMLNDVDSVSMFLGNRGPWSVC